MEKQGNYLGNFLDYNSVDLHNHHQEQQQINQEIGATSSDHHHHNNNNQIVDYMLHNPPPLLSSNFGSNSFDKLRFADVMQFADSGLNDQHKMQDDENRHFSLMADDDQERGERDDDGNLDKRAQGEGKGKRKRPRSVKSVEEVESQRMTHIAVERNRRKQMNEHLRLLRSLMPSSYVQRGDQASIIGGAIEFVRELEQLLQCLESQKRRRLYGDGARPAGDPPTAVQQHPPADQAKLPEYEAGLQEESAESKSCLADVEVKILGFDGVIKILSRRMPGQLVRAITALEDLHLSILHTNVTTIEQTVLYSFNVKISGEVRFGAEDLANSVQQIFSFIQANGSM